MDSEWLTKQVDEDARTIPLIMKRLEEEKSGLRPKPRPVKPAGLTGGISGNRPGDFYGGN